MTFLRRTSVSFFFPSGLHIFLCCTYIPSHRLSVLPLGQISHCQKQAAAVTRKTNQYWIVLAMKLIANVKITVITIRDANSWFSVDTGSHLQLFCSSDSLWGHGVLHSTARQAGKACCHICSFRVVQDTDNKLGTSGLFFSSLPCHHLCFWAYLFSYTDNSRPKEN